MNRKSSGTLWLALTGFCLLAGSLAAQPSRQFVDSCNALGAERIFARIVPSIQLYRSVVQQSRELGYPEGEARALESLGLAQRLAGQLDASVEAELQAIRLYEQLEDRHALARIWGSLGYGQKQRDLPRALQYMSNGIRIAEQDRDSLALEALYNNYGVLQEMQGDLDSARVFYQRALDLATLRPDSSGVPFCLNHLAGLDALAGDFGMARARLTRSDRLRRGESGQYGRIENTVLWGDTWLAEGQPDSALARYREAIAIPGASEQKYLMSYCYGKMAEIHEQKADYREALNSQRAFQVWRDSMQTLERDTRISALELEFETEKKDRLLAENTLALARRDRLLVSLVSLLLLGVVLLLVGLWQLKLKRERQRQALAFREQTRRAENERRLAAERLRISRELHDNIGSQLTFLVGTLDTLGWRMPADPLAKRLKELSTYGRHTLAELRGTVWAMQREHTSLTQVRDRLAELFQRSDRDGLTRIELAEPELPESLDDCEIGAAQALTLLRVAQEAVSNALRHAHATRIRLALGSDTQGIWLEVCDDGSGFDPGLSTQGSGLMSMRARCEEHGGQFRLTSDADGTRIRCVFPIVWGKRRIDRERARPEVDL
ncbi:MAG: hypothetical protein H6678_11690 [Candidatus Delongbacteria bacterium]|nr:hypothetical protein [Candidatus Cloacimonadota bacterium]MCB9474465.1 hypothetical protein [Candidatus Delongbacteria bacterium]